MKKKYLGCIAAVLSSLGFSSFSISKQYGFSYYWFYVITPVPSAETHPTFAEIDGDYLGYSPAWQLDAPSCDGSGALCLVGYTLNSISGFSALGIPTGLKTMGFTGIPRSYATTGSTTQFY